MTKVLNLALLGPLQIKWQDQPLPDLVSGKAQALLCYLAMNGRSHSRQAIAGLLWGDLPEADARRNLRGVLLKARQAIGDYLLSDNQTLAFNFDLPHHIDVVQFRHWLLATSGKPTPQHLAAAVALYRGDFLTDFYIRQAPAFEDWVMQERTALREQALAAHLQLATHHLRAGTHTAGIATARQALTLDPVREDAHAVLMQLLAANGQRSAALAQFEQCQHILATEMAMAPSPQTLALASQIRSGSFTPTSSQPTPAATPQNQVSSPPPAPFLVGPPVQHPRQFFGRERILKRLFGLFKQRPLQNAAIIGPRRSGKTSLLHYLRTITTTPPADLRPGQPHDWLPQPHSYRWVFVDFQDARLGTLAGLLPYLLAEMGLSAPQPCDLDTFLDIISDELTQPTIILLDEIGVALSRYPELDDAFWESLRSLASHQVRGNLGFVLSADRQPAQLAQHSGLGSPFFNIFGYVATLEPLTDEAAHALIASAPVAIPAAEAAWIIAESDRWPILLQLLCREYTIAHEEGLTGPEWRDEARQQLASIRQSLTQPPT